MGLKFFNSVSVGFILVVWNLVYEYLFRVVFVVDKIVFARVFGV